VSRDIREERVALFQEKLLNLRVVLDHAIVDEGDRAVAAHVRVGVGVGHAAMGGPAGVAHAIGALEAVLGDFLLEGGHAADLLCDGEFSALLHDDAR
jgi:hypothetical protein